MNKLLIGFLLAPWLCYGQNLTLKGIITDSKTGTLLPYAYVQVKGKALGTVTNSDGFFKLTVPKSLQIEMLVFSYVGYVSQEIRANQLTNPVAIKLKPDTKILDVVVIEPEKMISAKALLRKVIKNIPTNYKQDTVLANGYYRELLKENGVYIKYADAVVQLNELPYQGERFKWKEFDRSGYNVMTTGFSSFYGGDRLHRYHFSNRTLKREDAKIIDSRSSDNLTRERMDANIEGGPLNLIGRDRVKYLEKFMRLGKKNKYIYSVSEQETKNNDWEYILSFKSKYDQAYLKKRLKKKKPRLWMNSGYFLEGQVHIDQETFAATSINYNVPSHLKKYICGYDTMAIKHFDYKINLAYKKFNDKYSLAYVRMEDEFIFVDTIENETTPYAAVAELFIEDNLSQRKTPFSKDSLFANSDFNHIYDLPLSYNADFWNEYMDKHPQYKIAQAIRGEMEINKSLEKQFEDKHKKDTTLRPPLAKIIPHNYTIHGKTYTDNYAWLKDTSAPLYNNEVMEYIDAENKYARNYFIPLRKQERILYREMLSHMEKEYTSLPAQIRGYKYYYEYGFEEEHPIYFRTNLDSTQREILLDTRELAKKYDYYLAGFPSPSPNDNLIAFSENTTGSSKVVLKFKNLSTGEMLNDSIQNASGFIWLNNQSLLYTEQEKKTNRSYIVKLHVLNTPQKEDQTLFIEKDPKFGVGVSKNKTENMVFISSSSAVTSETYFFRINESKPKLKLLYPRTRNIIYYVNQSDDKFFITTNDEAKNFKVVEVDTANFDKTNWKIVLPKDKDHMLVGFDILKKYYVVTDLDNAQNRIRIIERASGKEHTVKFKKNIYKVNAQYSREYDIDSIRISYSTAVTPSITYSYNIPKEEKTVLKKQKLPFPVMKWGIKVERVMVTARDGEEIPMTLIYNKHNIKGKDASHRKAYITSYGSYGASMSVGFNANIYPLLERGFTVAIPHIRGGSDKGYEWYEDGKMLNKKNTFYDFIDCTQYLINEEYSAKGNIVAEGASAGGLLMGAVANMAPDLYKLIVLDVPFVDVVNTMLDDKLPLTTGEYEEWGNPHIKKQFKYIKSYSPYDNVTAQDYPTMLFTTGLSDQQVGYWEPAKMVAKLRTTKTDDNEILLLTRLHSGHGGQAGRYEYIRNLAKQYAFIIDAFMKDKKADVVAKK
jgi:protease II